MSNILTEAAAHLKEGAENIEGWFNDIKPHVETVLAEAEKYADPFIEALAAAGLKIPPKYTAIALDFLGKLTQIDQVIDTPATPATPADPAAPAAPVAAVPAAS